MNRMQLCLVGVMVAVVLLTGGPSWADARAEHPVTQTALIAGPSDAARDVSKRVLLDRRFKSSSLEHADLIWVIDTWPNAAQLTQLMTRVRQGAALVWIPSANRPYQHPVLGVQPKSLIQTPSTLVVAASNVIPQAAHDVVWSTVPQVRARWQLPSDNAVPEMKLWVKEATSNEAVVVRYQYGQGEIVVMGLPLSHIGNRDLLQWPYLNYWLYTIACQVTSQSPQPFATWEKSPLPGTGSKWWFAVGLVAAWLATLLLFRFVRRYSRRRPQVLEQFFHHEQTTAHSPKTQWQAVGFSRPLAGFFVLTAALIILFVPYYWLTNLYLPNQVQPFPQARGMWDFAWESLQVAWFLFDAGTFVAFVKYFSEYRVKDPREAVKSAQFFVWWQILTGLAQVTLAVVAALWIIPHTRYSYSSTLILLAVMGQFPGFFNVFTFFFQGYQRFDYNIGLDLLSDWILRFALQIPCVLYFRQWGIDHPEYGEAFGAAIGVGVGYYVATLVTFVLSFVLYRRLGLRVAPLLMCHADVKTARRMLSYGARVVSGQVFYRAAKTVETFMISFTLLNYTEWLGLSSQISQNLLFLLPIAYRFFETAMAALSESYGNQRTTLSQYYVVRFTQVGSLYTAIAVSLMLALGPTFILKAMDPQWHRAADYIVWAAVIGVFFAPAWLSDMLQKAADRPGLFAWVLGGEQLVRIGLFAVLIPLFQFKGYYVALLSTIVLKVIVAWAINHRSILRLRIFPWVMWGAPLLAGIVNFAGLRLIVSVLDVSGKTSMMLFFFAAAMVSFPCCFFLIGLFGGYDRFFIDEMSQASKMTGLFRPLTRALYGVAHFGDALCPKKLLGTDNHGGVARSIATEAQQQAQALQTQTLQT